MKELFLTTITKPPEVIVNKFFFLSLVTQPMLQPTPNQTELRLMVSKSIFNIDSKNVSEKFLHRHSWKNPFFWDFFLWSPKVGFEKKKKIRSDGFVAWEYEKYVKNSFIKNFSPW